MNKLILAFAAVALSTAACAPQTVTEEASAEDILAELESLDSPDEPEQSDMGSTLTAAYPQEDLSTSVSPAITEVTILPEGTETKPVYQITLTEALRHQAVSDSLKDLAISARALVSI